MQTRRSALFTMLLLAACAPYEPVPEDFGGPVATVEDSGFSEDETRARLFGLVAIDGRVIENTFSASAGRSRGEDAELTTVFPDRPVPIRRMMVTLRGSHASGAPLHAMAARVAGTFFSVEGTVEFTPMTGRRYRVTGRLDKERSSVWIEDMATGEPVTAIVSR